MTKEDLRKLRLAAQVLRTEKFKDIAEKIEAIVKEYEAGKYRLQHDFWGEELYLNVRNGFIKTGKEYDAEIFEEEGEGETTLRIADTDSGENIEDFTYPTEMEARDDIDELRNLGYTIIQVTN